MGLSGGYVHKDKIREHCFEMSDGVYKMDRALSRFITSILVKN
ncbi:hypothetical protein CSG_19250 [Campylobacter fetus subsp. venerealis str. 84-112]|nr:hypothetical protein CSG_7580 [Campylobacter fetus subsp. venerealis str. 84-112]CDF65836.1 hypothetical protein CSG_19250 [Campylobacter fetus subsp. venerealis str. 84-112]